MNHDEPKNFFSQLGQIGLNGGVFLAGGITQKTVVLVKQSQFREHSGTRLHILQC